MEWRPCTAQEAQDLWDAGFQVRRMRPEVRVGSPERVWLGRVEVAGGEWPELVAER